jgi:hypothetical protein
LQVTLLSSVDSTKWALQNHNFFDWNLHDEWNLFWMLSLGLLVYFFCGLATSYHITIHYGDPFIYIISQFVAH